MFDLKNDPNDFPVERLGYLICLGFTRLDSSASYNGEFL